MVKSCNSGEFQGRGGGFGGQVTDSSLGSNCVGSVAGRRTFHEVCCTNGIKHKVLHDGACCGVSSLRETLNKGMLTQDLFARALGPVNKLSKFILTSPFIENNVQIPACQF